MPSTKMASTSKSSNSLPSDVGNWVDADRFWGRERELASLAELIRGGANIAISAPRRIGKTSLMHEVARRLEGEFLAIHVDLQGAVAPEDMVVELTLASSKHRDLHKRALEVFRNALGEVKQIQARELAVELRDSAATDWQSKANGLLEEFAASAPPVVIYFDELAILVNRLLKGHDYLITPERIAAVDQLMSWLRKASIRHARQIRFVIASSIGLAPVLAQAKLTATLNTFTSFHLPPWDRETARGALVALANHAHVSWAEGAPDAVLDRLGIHVPHHVQVFWRLLREDARQRNVFYVSAEDVQRIYQTDLLGAHGHLELAHYEERLSTTLGSQLATLAVDLLSETAITGALPIASARALAASGDAQQLRDVIGVLVHDGYLQLEHDAYVFSNKLLRDWWHTRHRLTHLPLAERGTND
jgi:hypothetical protein